MNLNECLASRDEYAVQIEHSSCLFLFREVRVLLLSLGGPGTPQLPAAR